MAKIAYLPPLSIVWKIVGATLIFFLAATIRHLLFQSNALDLGWFDQAIYLISQGQTPIISFRGFHILGDHASLIVYPLALFYKIFKSNIENAASTKVIFLRWLVYLFFILNYKKNFAEKLINPK